MCNIEATSACVYGHGTGCHVKAPPTPLHPCHTPGAQGLMVERQWFCLQVQGSMHACGNAARFRHAVLLERCGSWVFGLYWYCYCYSIRLYGPSVMGLFSGYSPLTSEVCSCFASDLYCTDPASGKRGNMLMHKYQTMRLPHPFASWQVMLACCRASSKTELPARRITVPQQWPLLASQ